VENSITAYLHEDYDEGAILTGWVVIAEYMSSDGIPGIAAFAAEGMPYWKINGLIEAAPHEIVYEEEDEQADDLD
jgi:hypothetical protein